MESSSNISASYDERRALLLGVTSVLLWSTASTAFKLALAVYTPLQVVTLATLTSAVLLSSAWGMTARGSATRASASRGRGSERRILLRDACLLGLINPLLYYPILLLGYERLPAQIAQPLNYTWAIVIALLAVPLLGQRLGRRLLQGMLLSYSGALVLILGAHRGPLGAPDALGLACIFASTLLWALYWILKTRTQSEPLPLLALSFTLAALVLSALLTLQGRWPPLELGPLLSSLWIGLFEMGLTFLLWQGALRATRQVGRISQLIFLAPFLSLIPIALVLGEPLQWSSLVGLTIIVAGLLLAGPAEGQAGNAPPR